MLRRFRKFRISLRLALILFTLFAVWFGWLSNRAYEQRTAVAEIIQAGGRIQYSHRCKPIQYDAWVTFHAEPPGPKFLRKMIGNDYFTSVIGIHLSDVPETHIHEIVKMVGNLKKVRFLDLQNQPVTDNDLSHISNLKLLEQLLLDGSNVSDDGLRHLAHLDNLVELGLESTNISVVGLRNARIDDKRRLHLLMLDDTQISDEIFNLVHKLPKLDLLTVIDSNVTESGVQRFTASRPWVSVSFD